MKISELKNGQEVICRTGRYLPTLDHPDWGPWEKRRLCVQGFKGEVAIITLSPDWVEYAPDDFDPIHKVFEMAGYYLEIQGLE